MGLFDTKLCDRYDIKKEMGFAGMFRGEIQNPGAEFSNAG